MARSAFSKVMWVGRATVFVVGLAVVLALMFGVATTALGATGGQFILGKFNAAETPTSLVSTLTDATKSALNVQNRSGGPAVSLGVAQGQAPIRVNAGAGTATNLSADKIDGKNSSEFAAGVNGKATDAAHADQADSATSAQNAQNADNLDGKDASAFYTGRTYVVRETRTGTTQGAAIQLHMVCDEGDKATGGGLSAPFGGTILRDVPMKRPATPGGSLDYVQTGDSPDAWHVSWVPNFTSNNNTFGYVVCADLGQPRQ